MDSAGLPQVILPLWADLYNYAALAETIGVGVWSCKETTPDWTSECLTKSLLKVLDGARGSVSFRNKAKQLGDKVQAGDKGRDIAAREIAKLAYVR
jgi:UDP:flavonoid glycosyltransferase YjiC (YdhE family)